MGKPSRPLSPSPVGVPLPTAPDEIERFQEELRAWFAEQKRELPWRKPPYRDDAYAVLVSEVMLQQTRVETVIPYFLDWMDRWPTVKALSEADEEDVLEAWQGLGFYNRARRLHEAATRIVHQHEGAVPDTEDELRSLPGVGPYTAAAVLAFAHGEPKPAVDGNTVRVWARFTGTRADPSQRKVKSQARDHLAPLVDGEDPGSLVEAFIELGATVCTPQAPLCPTCPIHAWCTAHEQDRVDEIPRVQDQGPIPVRRVIAVWHENERGVLLRKRPTEGLLGGLWGLPMGERRPEEDPADTASRILDGVSMQLGEEPVARVEHTFSHKRWRVHVHEASSLEHTPTGDELARWPREALREPAASALDEKVLSALSQTTLARFS